MSDSNLTGKEISVKLCPTRDNIIDCSVCQHECKLRMIPKLISVEKGRKILTEYGHILSLNSDIRNKIVAREEVSPESLPNTIYY